FDDVPDDELRTALADTTILVERLRQQFGIEREEIIADIRARTEGGNNPPKDTKTLERIDLQTAAEIRRQTEDELAAQFEPGRWDKRANGLLKLGVSAFILTILGNILYRVVSDGVIQSALHSLLGGVITLLFVSAIGWILINTAQLLKYTLVPFLTELANDPTATVRLEW